MNDDLITIKEAAEALPHILGFKSRNPRALIQLSIRKKVLPATWSPLGRCWLVNLADLHLLAEIKHGRPKTKDKKR